MGNTDYYGLAQLDSADDLSGAQGDQFVNGDRSRIDALLWLGAQGHHHRGPEVGPVNPDPVTVAQNSAIAGLIPGGNRVYYRWAIYDIDTGIEGPASDESYFDLPDGMAAPAAPTLDGIDDAAGLLIPGDYYYVFSAYEAAGNLYETEALNPIKVTVPAGTNTNEITLTLPALPVGADGFNVYRRRAGHSHFYFLASIDMTPPVTEFVDDGAIDDDCERGLPASNNTSRTYQMLLTLPVSAPAGTDWKLYRTFDNSDWGHSHIATISGPATTHLDGAASTSAGQPMLGTATADNPDKIALTDAAEVDGVLPTGLVAHPFEIAFAQDGPATVETGTYVWVCEFPNAEIVAVRAVCAPGTTPAATSVICDIHKGTDSATPVYTTVFTTQGNRPAIGVGITRGNRTSPDADQRQMVRGESLVMDVDQADAGAENVVVTVSMVVYGFPDTVSYDPAVGAGGQAGGY